jgi:hypothetical protein
MLAGQLRKIIIKYHFPPKLAAITLLDCSIAKEAMRKRYADRAKQWLIKLYAGSIEDYSPSHSGTKSAIE